MSDKNNIWQGMDGVPDIPDFDPPKVKINPQLDLLAQLSDEMRSTPSDEREKAFLAKHLIQVTLPHSKPKGDPAVWARKNGDLSLMVRPYARMDEKTGKPEIIYPSGTVPRLFLYWLNTEAVKNQKALRGNGGVISLGDSLNDFLRELGMNPATGGGKRSDAYRVRRQIEALTRSSVQIQKNGIHESGAEYSYHKDMTITEESFFWWDTKAPDQKGLFPSQIKLTNTFLDFMTEAPVPLEMSVLNALKGSSLALDAYNWLVYRSYVVTASGKPAFISWNLLAQQFGSDYANVKDFKRKLKESLRKVAAAHMHLDFNTYIEEGRGGIHIRPGLLLIEPK